MVKAVRLFRFNPGRLPFLPDLLPKLLIMDMITLDGFNDFIFKRMNEKVDVSALEKEREQLRRQLAQVSGAKTKLNQMRNVCQAFWKS